MQVLARRGVEARGAPGQGHLVLALQPTLKGGAGLEQPQFHVDAGAAEFLLHDREVALDALAAVDEREACLFAPLVDQHVVGVGAGEEQAANHVAHLSPPGLGTDLRRPPVAGPCQVFARLGGVELVGPGRLQGVGRAREERGLAVVLAEHQVVIEAVEVEQVLDCLAKVLVLEDRGLEVHVQAVDPLGPTRKHPRPPDPPIAHRREGVLLVPGARGVFLHQVELATAQPVQAALGGNLAQMNAIEVEQTLEALLAVAPPIGQAGEGDGLAAHRLADHVGAGRDLELVVAALDPVGIEHRGVRRRGPQPRVVGQRSPAGPGADDAQRVVVDGIDRLEESLRVAVVEGRDDVLRLHHPPGEHVVPRSDRLAVAEAGVAVELEVQGALVVCDGPVRRHPGNEAVGVRVAHHQRKVHREGPVPAREGVVGIRSDQAEGERVGVDRAVQGAAADRPSGANGWVVFIGDPADVRGQGDARRGRRGRRCRRGGLRRLSSWSGWRRRRAGCQRERRQAAQGERRRLGAQPGQQR